jgi:hypothetical protein
MTLEGKPRRVVGILYECQTGDDGAVKAKVIARIEVSGHSIAANDEGSCPSCRRYSHLSRVC